ncbi:MAG: nitroreductase/quinone reductase family protein [Candidatus Limnocylindria bacterium]
MKVTLTLIATGRRSGTPREVELYAFPDGKRLVIVGSRGGSVRDPVWADNLRAQPRAAIRRGDRLTAVHAREVAGEERDRLWALVSKAFPMYLYYEGKTKRTIPIFVLDVLDDVTTA